MLEWISNPTRKALKQVFGTLRGERIYSLYRNRDAEDRFKGIWKMFLEDLDALYEKYANIITGGG